MKMLTFVLTMLMLLPSMVFSAHVAVLETGVDERSREVVTFSDRQYMTNVLREQAVRILPADQGYTIMTRENILAMLPPGKSLEDCEGSCLAETGRNIAADYICKAFIGTFNGALTLSAELYETAGNKLVASFNGRGADLNALLEIIESKSQDFFGKIKDNGPAAPEEEPVAQDSLGSFEWPSESEAGKSIPANVEDKSGAGESRFKVRWIPVGIGSAVLVVGSVLAIVGNSQAKSTYNKGYADDSEYLKNREDIKSAQTLRKVGIGIAIAGMIGLGVSFAF